MHSMEKERIPLLQDYEKNNQCIILDMKTLQQYQKVKSRVPKNFVPVTMKDVGLTGDIWRNIIGYLDTFSPEWVYLLHYWGIPDSQIESTVSPLLDTLLSKSKSYNEFHNNIKFITHTRHNRTNEILKNKIEQRIDDALRTGRDAINSLDFNSLHSYLADQASELDQEIRKPNTISLDAIEDPQPKCSSYWNEEFRGLFLCTKHILTPEYKSYLKEHLQNSETNHIQVINKFLTKQIVIADNLDLLAKQKFKKNRLQYLLMRYSCILYTFPFLLSPMYINLSNEETTTIVSFFSGMIFGTLHNVLVTLYEMKTKRVEKSTKIKHLSEDWKNMLEKLIQICDAAKKEKMNQ